MELFQLNNWKLDIHPEAYTMIPFKKILERDKSKDKNIALQELAYVYHNVDFKSPFAAILDGETKQAEIIKSVITVKNWKPDKEVLEAIKFYKDREKTTTSEYLESVKIALSEVNNFLREFKKNGVEIQDMVRVNTMIANSIETVKTVRELEKLVKQDKEVEDKLRGGKDRGYFMDDDERI